MLYQHKHKNKKNIKERNERIMEAKQLLNANEESKTASKETEAKKLPSPTQIDDQDSTS